MYYLSHLSYKRELRTRVCIWSTMNRKVKVFIVHVCCTCLTWATPWTETATPCWVYTCALSIWRVIRLRQILKQIISSFWLHTSHHACRVNKAWQWSSFPQFLGKKFFYILYIHMYLIKFVYKYFLLHMYKYFSSIFNKVTNFKTNKFSEQNLEILLALYLKRNSLHRMPKDLHKP